MGSLARSCRHRISLLWLLLWAPMGDGLLGWESSCPRRLPGGSRLRGVPPRAAPSEPLRSLSVPAGRGRGRDPGWHPRGGGLSSPGSAKLLWGLHGLFPLPGALSWIHLDPASWHLAPALFLAFQGKKYPFSSFFLPAMTTAKYFYFRGSHALSPPHRLAPGVAGAAPVLPGWLCKAKPPAATSRLGQSPVPGVPYVGKWWERCV